MPFKSNRNKVIETMGSMLSLPSRRRSEAKGEIADIQRKNVIENRGFKKMEAMKVIPNEKNDPEGRYRKYRMMKVIK